MKALSIKQPWASLIAHGIKDIENRTWLTKFRGKVLIHASAKTVKDFDFTIEQSGNLWMNGFDQTTILSCDERFPVSAIIGEVEIVDCVINYKSIWAEKTEGVTDSNTQQFIPSNKQKPIYNWVLANPVLYDKSILNVKGKLSFWEFECNHQNIKREDGCDECLDCGNRNF